MLYNGRVGQSNFLYTFERISVVVAVVEVVVVVVHSGYSLYGNTRRIPFSMVPDVWWFAPDVFVCFVVNGAPRPTWAALAGPGNHNSEVYRDTINTVNATREGKHFRNKSALRGKVRYHSKLKPQLHQLCVRDTWSQYNSRGDTAIIISCRF